MHWALTEDLIRLSVERIPVRVAGCISFYAQDLRQHKADADLIRFPASEGFELLEVKGPGDMQKNQKVWFADSNN